MAGVLGIAFTILQLHSEFATTIPRTLARNRDVWFVASYAIAYVYHRRGVHCNSIYACVVPGVARLHHSQIATPHYLRVTSIMCNSDGCGVGFAFGQPSYVVQTVLPPSDVPMGVTLITLFQNLSAAVFVAVAQGIFQGQLVSALRAMNLPEDVDVSATGAAQIPR